MISLMSRNSISLLSTPHIHVVFTVCCHTLLQHEFWNIFPWKLTIDFESRIYDFILGLNLSCSLTWENFQNSFPSYVESSLLWNAPKNDQQKGEGEKKVKSMNARNVEQFECSLARISQHLAGQGIWMWSETRKKGFCYIRNGQQQSDDICRKNFSLQKKIYIIIHIYRPSAPLCVCSVSHSGSSEVARILNVK